MARCSAASSNCQKCAKEASRRQRERAPTVRERIFTSRGIMRADVPGANLEESSAVKLYHSCLYKSDTVLQR